VAASGSLRAEADIGSCYDIADEIEIEIVTEARGQMFDPSTERLSGGSSSFRRLSCRSVM
jgi:hypothetical protein